MHKEIAILFLGLAFLSCSPKNEEGQAGTELAGKETELSNAKIEFEEDNFDFGTINEGDEVSHAFKFTNTGTEPLQIISVNVSCGCTVAAGASDEIVINFNSTGKTGMNQKSVGVLSNAQNNQETLTFTAKVEPKAGS
jgi:hypothetical protein